MSSNRSQRTRCPIKESDRTGRVWAELITWDRPKLIGKTPQTAVIFSSVLLLRAALRKASARVTGSLFLAIHWVFDEHCVRNKDKKENDRPCRLLSWQKMVVMETEPSFAQASRLDEAWPSWQKRPSIVRYLFSRDNSTSLLSSIPRSRQCCPRESKLTFGEIITTAAAHALWLWEIEFRLFAESRNVLAQLLRLGGQEKWR